MATIARNKKQAGFTLIEILITLGLFLILACIALPSFNFLHRLLVKNEVYHIHAVSEYMRKKAMATGQEQYITFDVKNNKYTYDGILYSLPKSVQFASLPDIKGPPSAPYSTIKSPITVKRTTMTFYPSGIIDAGTIYLADKDKQIQYALSSPVSQVSLLRIYRYNGKWVLL